MLVEEEAKKDTDDEQKQKAKFKQWLEEALDEREAKKSESEKKAQEEREKTERESREKEEAVKKKKQSLPFTFFSSD